MGVRPLNLAVLGATGAVGRVLVQALDEGALGLGTLRLLATERSAGTEVEVRGERLRVEVVRDGSFDGIDVAVFAAGAAAARTWAPRAWSRGCAVVDLSAAFRGEADVPLVVPALNRDALGAFRARGVVAIPGPAASQLAAVLAPLHAAAGVERVVVTSCEPVSGAGQVGVEELEAEMRSMLTLQEPPSPTAHPHRVAFNVVPQVGTVEEDRRTDEERGAVEETCRLLAPPPPRMTVTALRVPVFYGSTQALNVRMARALAAADARALLAKAPGVKVIDSPREGVYPMPMLAVNDDAVLVGRIRDDPTQEHGLDLVTTSDNLRRAGAGALAAAEVLFREFLLPR